MRLLGRRTFRSLRAHRNYRLYFAGQITSVCGTWMQNVAMYWLVLDLTHSAVAVGVLSLARFGPFTIFGLAGGVLADRFDNRRTVIVTQSVQMLLSGVLAAITLAGTVEPWELYAIAAGIGTAFVFDVPARQSLIVQLVGRDELANAVALNSSLVNTARIAGPALAGVVIAVAGAGWCFAINTASFVAVIAGLLAMRTRELYPVERRGRPTIWRGTREGLAYVRESRTTMILLGMVVVLMSLSFNFNVLLPVLVKQTLDAGPRTLGVLSACFGVGALAGALTSATLANARWRVMLGASGLVGVTELAIAPLHQAAAVGALLFVCGLCFTTYMSNSNATIQLGDARPPPRARARDLLLRVGRPGAARGAAARVAVRVGGTALALALGGAAALGATALAAVAVGRMQKAGAEPAPA